MKILKSIKIRLEKVIESPGIVELSYRNQLHTRVDMLRIAHGDCVLIGSFVGTEKQDYQKFPWRPFVPGIDLTIRLSVYKPGRIVVVLSATESDSL